ncbi:hypothetical protein [Lentzea guizhouensis]|uniref:hypothetical protein n=1 Tax=Lentzea guizhouensis TaxID=1586287 RepID=UPI0009F6F8C8|nr:hypothetical protein [Lentzea guizhouensis]
MKNTLIRRAALPAVLALALAPLTAGLASAAETRLVFDCKAASPGGDVLSKFEHTVDGSAPATVAPGGDLTATLVAASSTTDPDSVQQISNLVFRVPLPANSSYVSHSLSGGSGLGDTPPSTSIGPDGLLLTVPGPIAGGASFTLPTFSVVLRAGDGGTVETRFGGSSHTDPSLTFDVVAKTPDGGSLPLSNSCFLDPNPVLTTTQITS